MQNNKIINYKKLYIQKKIKNNKFSCIVNPFINLIPQ